MGQYRQWLHYRHVDRQLQAQMEELTEALTCLREKISNPNTPSPGANNRIIQALMLYAENNSRLSASRGEESILYGQQPERFSQVLFEHNRLPDVDQHHGKDRHETVSPTQSTPTYEPLPPIPHKAMNTPLEEGNTPLDESQPTEPQIALPWWLQRAALSATQSTSLDSQSVRTNRLVQRWLERWGRQEEGTGEQTTNGHYPPPQQERKSS